MKPQHDFHALPAETPNQVMVTQVGNFMVQQSGHIRWRKLVGHRRWKNNSRLCEPADKWRADLTTEPKLHWPTNPKVRPDPPGQLLKGWLWKAGVSAQTCQLDL
jgi:hypothetical protein